MSQESNFLARGCLKPDSAWCRCFAGLLRGDWGGDGLG